MGFHVVSATRIKGILQWIVLWYIRLLLFHGILSWLSAFVVFDWWITLGVRSHLKLLASLSIPVLSFVACAVERTSKTCPSIVLGLYNKSTLLDCFTSDADRAQVFLSWLGIGNPSR